MNGRTEENKTIAGLSPNIISAGFVSFFMDVSSEMVYPLLPLFLSSVLGVNKSLIGLIEGIAESTASILKIYSGWISDRIGNRKKLMVVGYAISTFSRPLLAVADVWHYVLAGRFMDRLGKGIRTAPRDAIIAESSKPSAIARSFSFHRSMDTLGAVVGPALALVLMHLFSSYRIVFWLSMVPGIVAVLVIIFCIKEKKKEPSCEKFQGFTITIKQLNGQAKLFIVIVFIFAFGNSSDVFLILKARQSGIVEEMIPAVYLMFNLIYALSAIPAGIAADTFGRKRIILSGFILFSLLYCGFATAQTSAAIWILFAVYGLFMGLSEGVQKAYLATITSENARATVFGLYAAAIGCAVFPANLIGGMLWDHISSAATFYFGAAAAAISAVLFMGMIFVSKRSALKRLKVTG